jgi:hypothetical protein
MENPTGAAGLPGAGYRGAQPRFLEIAMTRWLCTWAAAALATDSLPAQAVRRYDMGTATSAVAPGCTAVDAGTTYSAAKSALAGLALPDDISVQGLLWELEVLERADFYDRARGYTPAVLPGSLGSILTNLNAALMLFDQLRGDVLQATPTIPRRRHGPTRCGTTTARSATAASGG